MKFLFYFRLSSYLLIGCGFLALLLTEFFGVFTGLIFALILPAGWLVDSNRIRLPISNRFWNLAILPVAILCGIDILFIRRDLVVGIVSFLIFLQITKLFHKKENRDYLFLYVISFIQLLTVTVMTTDVIFSIPFILYTILATWTLMIFYLKHEIESYQGTHQNIFKTPQVEKVLNPYFFLGTSILVFMMLAIILVIFFTVPRISIGYLFRERERIQQISGFSEEVKFGSFGNIRLDHTPIMRIELPDISERLPAFVRWRGISLDYYDGQSWKVSRKQEKKVAGRIELTLDAQRTYFFNIGAHDRTSTAINREKLLRQEIEMSPINSRVIFGAHQIQGISGVFTPLSVDGLSGTIRSDFPASRGRKYVAYSDIEVPSEEELREASTAETQYTTPILSSFEEQYTQLPPISSEIKNLARSLTKNYLNLYDKAKAIEQYLQNNFEYRLNVKRDEDVTPLEDFFFRHQAGHCEYFATGMVVLLRTLNIPARIVNGFQQGQWNEFGKYFIVRKSDAHSWVEVFFPSHGWIVFDPTPSTAFSEDYAPVLDRIPVVSTMSRYFDFIRMRWNRYIVEYNLMDQVQLILNIRYQTRYFQKQMAKYLEGLKFDLPQFDSIKALFTLRNLSLLSAIGLVLTAFILIILRFRQDAKLKELFPHSPPSPRHLKVVKLYLEMLGILAKKGLNKETYVTPQEFTLQLARKQVPYFQEVQEITRLYYKARYGRTRISSEEIDRLQHLVETVEVGLPDSYRNKPVADQGASKVS